MKKKSYRLFLCLNNGCENVIHYAFASFFTKCKGAQLVKPEGHTYKQKVHNYNYCDVEYLCGYSADGAFYRLTKTFKGRNITGVQIVVVGLQKMCHNCRNHIVDKNEQKDGLYIFLFGILSEIKKQYQQKFHNHDIVKGYRMKAHKAVGVVRYIVSTVYKSGIYHHKNEYGSTQGGGYGTYSITVLSSVKSHDGKHENKQRTKMEGQVIKVISF